MIVETLMVVSTALMGVDVVDCSGAGGGGDQRIGVNPEWIED